MEPTKARPGILSLQFLLGAACAAAFLTGSAELFLRLFPPQDLEPYLGDESSLTGIYRPDDDFSVTYRSWDDFQADNAERLREYLPFEAERRPLWAFFGNSFVEAAGMLGDHARAGVPDRHIFYLSKNEYLYLRFAQIKLLLEHGLKPERIFVEMMPVDVLPLGTQPLATNHVSARGALTYLLPKQVAPVDWCINHSYLALTANVRAGRGIGNPGFRSDRLYEGLEEPLLDDLRRLFGNLARVAREHQVPITVLLIPAYHQITEGASCGFQDTLTPMLRDQGYDIFDPRDAFRRQPDFDGLFIPDRHFDPRGNDILLAELLKHLYHAEAHAMTFTELPFAIMTVVVFVLWLLCRKNYRASIGFLLTASLVFYGYHYWPLLFLVLTYCLVDWGVACWMERSRHRGRVLAAGVTFNLVVLGYWKYTPLVLRTAATLLPTLDLPAPPHDWTIPFGISFYAFTGIAYIVDVYRRTTPAEPSFLRYTLSAMFFPHLVAGPILRPNDFLEKLRPGVMPTGPETPLEALLLIARGAFKKMVIANRLALAIEPFFAHVGDASTAGVWSLPYVYLYALQIYFDFSGYTDLARGLGLMFGFRWPDNFNLPYLATSVKDFWRRWHITLSLFLKDYLYVPLGGNRRGKLRTQVNLMLTMLLGGLWHGASWSFMVWGGLHGLFLVLHGLWAERSLGGWLRARTGLVGALWQMFSMALTFHCVCLAWCFFRLSVFAESLLCVQKWFVFDADKLLIGGAADRSIWLLLVAYGTVTWLVYQRAKLIPALASLERPLARGFSWGFAATVLLLAMLLSPGGEKPPFIYFQF